MRVSISLVVSFLAVLLSPGTCAEEALPEGFLEFLGSMVEQDGELVGPLSLESDFRPIGIGDISSEQSDELEKVIESEARND